MATTTVEDERLKELFKTAIVEVLEERGELLRELVVEALEDVGLARAIDEGLQGATVNREEVLEVLEGGR